MTSASAAADPLTAPECERRLTSRQVHPFTFPRVPHYPLGLEPSVQFLTVDPQHASDPDGRDLTPGDQLVGLRPTELENPLDLRKGEPFLFSHRVLSSLLSLHDARSLAPPRDVLNSKP